MAAECESLQSEELEAISSIFGDEWSVDPVEERKYSIFITEGTGRDQISATFEILLPKEYPLSAPPLYTLSAPCLRGEEKQKLYGSLEDTYQANAGEPILYLWIEQVRKIIQRKSTLGHPGSSSNINPGPGLSESVPPDGHPVEVTEESSIDQLDMTSPGHCEAAASLPAVTVDYECPDIFHGEPVTDRKSTFQAHFSRVNHPFEVRLVQDSLRENKKVANATHNMVAYRIRSEKTGLKVIQDCDDDGEAHAGSRMLHLLQTMQVVNVVVIVSRWYGGIQLGPDRFKHINNCTRNILTAHGLVVDNSASSSTGIKGKKKKR